MRKVNATIQKEITAALAALPEGPKPTMKAVSDAYRNSDLPVTAIVASLALNADATQTPAENTPVSQKSKQTAAQKAKEAEDATLAKAQAAAAKSKVLPATPEGWTPGESREGFVRYARRLRSNGQPVSAFRLSAAKKPEEVALAAELRQQFPQGTFVVVNHTTDVKAAFDSWADAYAFTCTMNSTQLARSVAAAIGEDGLASLSSIVGGEVTVRPVMVPAPEEEATEVKADDKAEAPKADGKEKAKATAKA